MLPDSGDEAIELNSESGPGIQISLPSAFTADDAEKTSSSTVEYEGNNDSSIVVAAVQGGSVAVNAVIESEDAPTSFPYDLDSSVDFKLVKLEDGSVVIEGLDGKFLGVILKPWAKDASGVEVPTHYEINGNTLTQVVEHRNRELSYPVVADPYLGKDIISSVRRVSSSQGTVFEVRPTAFGRLAPYWPVHTNYGWKEADAKGVPNRDGLQDQYLCHPFSVVARAKSSWNLDTWRPDVSFAATVAAACNP